MQSIGCSGQHLLHKPLPFYGSFFVFPSYSSSPSPSFSGLHLQCTSSSLGATSLWPAGSPKAIKYISTKSIHLPHQHWLLGKAFSGWIPNCLRLDTSPQSCPMFGNVHGVALKLKLNRCLPAANMCIYVYMFIYIYIYIYIHIYIYIYI